VDVAVEERIEIVLDETTVADLFCLPSQLEELAFARRPNLYIYSGAERILED